MKISVVAELVQVVRVHLVQARSTRLPAKSTTTAATRKFDIVDCILTADTKLKLKLSVRRRSCETAAGFGLHYCKALIQPAYVLVVATARLSTHVRAPKIDLLCLVLFACLFEIAAIHPPLICNLMGGGCSSCRRTTLGKWHRLLHGPISMLQFSTEQLELHADTLAP